jgi:hypothetical protein
LAKGGREGLLGMIFQKTKFISIFKPSLEKMVGIWQASLLAHPHGRLLKIWLNKPTRCKKNLRKVLYGHGFMGYKLFFPSVAEHHLR